MGCDIVNVFKRFVDLCNQVESGRAPLGFLRRAPKLQ